MRGTANEHHARLFRTPSLKLISLSGGDRLVGQSARTRQALLIVELDVAQSLVDYSRRRE
ncbi:MAG: hypothetical protein DLM60_03965 [Pseudonocardiales bacterium]|nr:MAG: hypothetical protein DLM60_03965 [Pseudonocardiales bacterium]